MKIPMEQLVPYQGTRAVSSNVVPFLEKKLSQLVPSPRPAHVAGISKNFMILQDFPEIP